MKKNNILNYLFICIVINMVPTILLGALGIPANVYTILNACAYILEVIIMLYAIRNNIKKISNKKLSILLLFFLVQILTQLINYFKWNSIEIEDIIHIFSVTINVFIFIFCCSYAEINKNDLIKFMKKMVLLGIIACIYNLFINGITMLNISNLVSSYSVSFSSFFPNRNQFGIFLLISIISNMYLKQESEKKIYRYFIDILFIINLVLTMSRTSIIGLITVFVAKFYFDYKNKGKKISFIKAILIIILICLIVLGIIYILENEDVLKLIDTLFIRTDNIETASGRVTVWENGINIVTENNLLLGVGRFMGIEFNKTIYGSDLENFHSIYVETFVIYGIVGLVLLAILLIYIIKNIKLSKIPKEIKSILLISIIVFLIISAFETTTRLSIGYADTISLIYFITIPIICANMKKEI